MFGLNKRISLTVRALLKNVNTLMPVCCVMFIVMRFCVVQEETAEEPKAPKIRQTPEDIKLEAIAITLAFHPREDILAAGDIDGDIYL